MLQKKKLFDHLFEIIEVNKLDKLYEINKSLYVIDLHDLGKKNIISMKSRFELFKKNKNVKTLIKCKSDYYRVKFLISYLKKKQNYKINETNKLKAEFDTIELPECSN